MKKFIQRTLQKILGFNRYLLLFSWFKIKTLKWDSSDKEGDFNFFLQSLGPGETVLDIGANIGIMTVLMAKACPEGQVYAFEPVPDNFEALQRIVSFMKVKNTSLHQVALGAQQGAVQMRMPQIRGVRMQGLSHIVHQSIEGYEGAHQEYSVPQIALDDFDFGPHRPIAAIKMDVENYERFVLEGAKELLSRDRPQIYCELWPNENREHCFRLLTALGYEAWVLGNSRLERFDPEVHKQHNFFFRFPPENNS
jgi:FkbM family methyltransferase